MIMTLRWWQFEEVFFGMLVYSTHDAKRSLMPQIGHEHLKLVTNIKCHLGRQYRRCTYDIDHGSVCVSESVSESEVILDLVHN